MADWALARKGRPPITWGFQSGTSGRRSRVYSKNGWNTVTESASSKLAPPQRTPSGADAVQGAPLQSMSALVSPQPGRRP